MNRPAVVFFAYHRIHLYTFRTVFEPLVARGQRVICAVFGEHVANGQVEPGLLRSLESQCELMVLAKGTAERVASRLLPRRLPANSRERRWARRAAGLLRRVEGPLAAVVIPLDYAGRHIRDRVGATRFVALQYEPFIQYHKSVRISDLQADAICTWGELDSRALRRAGVQAPLAAVGSPLVQPVPGLQFDGLRQRSGCRFLYTTTPLLRKRRLEFAVRLPYTRDDFAAMKRSAMHDLHFLLERFPDSQVTIKLHPFDLGEVEREFLDRHGSTAMELIEHRPDVPIQSYIEDCDMLVTMSSTTAFQALAAGKPVVLLNYQNWAGKHEQNLPAYGFALLAVDGPSLEWAVRKTIYDEETQAMLARNRDSYLAQVASLWGEAAVEEICRVILGETASEGEPLEGAGGPGAA
jgi:hypothetical protein